MVSDHKIKAEGLKFEYKIPKYRPRAIFIYIQIPIYNTNYIVFYSTITINE